MSQNVIDEYFAWLLRYIDSGVLTRKSRKFSKLLHTLFEIDFRWSIPMDENRMFDGLDLRDRFIDICYRDYPKAQINVLANKKCSVLEVMVALAFRCEESIMGDDDLGDRTGKWFWEMINSLGLSSMIDSNYDEGYVYETIDIFLDREYTSDGIGGLFTIPGCPYDLRDEEIWYQMNRYLIDILEE